MKTIAVTGGKGGVGKSTVSVLLANKFRNLDSKVVLCDCDVECPNDHLLLGVELKKPVERAYAKFPKLIEEKCAKCGLCVKKCRSNAIFQPKDGYPIFLPELCSGCGLCWNICPQGAIGVEEKAIGEVFVNHISCHSESRQVGTKNPSEILRSAQDDDKSSGFWLITGRSIGVVEETGPIVTKVRKYAESLGQEVGADYLLLDTAPGMHCSVIRALIGVDVAYAVTEPTPLGAHDLRLILKLLKVLEVPAKIILNQADLGNREPIDKIAKEFNTEIEYEIPYSKELVEAYSKGKLAEVTTLI